MRLVIAVISVWRADRIAGLSWLGALSAQGFGWATWFDVGSIEVIRCGLDGLGVVRRDGVWIG